MPATAVGRAKGRSTTASTNRFPGNSYRASTHPTSKPATALIPAAVSEAPIVKRYDASTRGVVAASQKCVQPMDALLKKTALKGIKTIKLKYVSANPRDSPNPGM